MYFNVTELEEFIDLVSEATCQLNFKKTIKKVAEF